MKWKIFILVIVGLFISIDGKAQNYDAAIGLITPSPTGITYKSFIHDYRAIEIMAGIQTSGFFAGSLKGLDVTALYEFHMPVLSRDLLFFYGFGGHAGIYQNTSIYAPNIGIDGIVGLDFSFSNIPFGFAFQYKPALDFVALATGKETILINGGGLSLRYLLY